MHGEALSLDSLFKNYKTMVYPSTKLKHVLTKYEPNKFLYQRFVRSSGLPTNYLFSL